MSEVLHVSFFGDLLVIFHAILIYASRMSFYEYKTRSTLFLFPSFFLSIHKLSISCSLHRSTNGIQNFISFFSLAVSIFVQSQLVRQWWRHIPTLHCIILNNVPEIPCKVPNKTYFMYFQFKKNIEMILSNFVSLRWGSKIVPSSKSFFLPFFLSLCVFVSFCLSLSLSLLLPHSILWSSIVRVDFKIVQNPIIVPFYFFPFMLSFSRFHIFLTSPLFFSHVLWFSDCLSVYSLPILISVSFFQISLFSVLKPDLDPWIYVRTVEMTVPIPTLLMI